ncbi:MAG: hypothetical protein RLZ37_1151 [Actinomycetota bacterium]
MTKEIAREIAHATEDQAHAVPSTSATSLPAIRATSTPASMPFVLHEPQKGRMHRAYQEVVEVPNPGVRLPDTVSSFVSSLFCSGSSKWHQANEHHHVCDPAYGNMGAP